jgi:hypothetical protein
MRDLHISDIDDTQTIVQSLWRLFYLKSFDQLPKSLKKAIRYINQDVNSIEKLELIEKTIEQSIKFRKLQLRNNKNS